MIEPPVPAFVHAKIGMPTLILNQRALLECGCSVWIGWRLFNREVATMARPCEPRHLMLIGRFNDLLRWSLEDGGTDRPLLDVIDELLAEASTETTAA